MVENKMGTLVIFVLSLVALVISTKLFFNVGIYVDEANLTPVIVLGGNFWLILDWARLGLIAIVCVASGIKLFLK